MGTRILSNPYILFIPFMCIFEEEDYLFHIILEVNIDSIIFYNNIIKKLASQ